jgi:SAM-dependent methyltransferase
MVELAQVEVGLAGVSDSVVVTTGDAHSLDYPDGAYELVVALGVVPYLHSPLRAFTEMARVLKPGGHAILSSDNVFRLNHLVDPLYTPFFPGREALRAALRRLRRTPPEGPEWHEWHPYSLRSVTALLRSAHLEVVRVATLGFGPFTLLGKRIFSEERSIAIHRRLQGLADRRAPVIRAVGAQHMLVARRL